MADVTQFDRYLNDNGPAALVLREWLMPVEGPDGVLFPATYAGRGEFGGGYNINDHAPDGSNVCLIDSVGSQANRIEPLFMKAPFAALVPQIVIRAGEKEVNILEAGHRAGDALVRCSSLEEDIEDAFSASIKGDVRKLAKIAPTSLVFGVWNSRGRKGNQEKRPRLVASTIRAFNVRKLTRSAVYAAPVDYSEMDVFSEEDKQKAEGDEKNPLSKRGFVNALASWTHGGIIADGGIRRDATLGLAALRLLRAGDDNVETIKLQRYILGLALIAFTTHTSSYLRQGCMLVRNPVKADDNEFVEVYANGDREPLNVTEKQALEFAEAAAGEFGVGDSQTVDFDKKRAVNDIKKDAESKSKSKRGAKKKDDDTSGGE